jgi:hydroxypyruvate reductase
VQRSQQQLREDALAIWQAGVAAVDSERLIQENVQIDGEYLAIGDETFALADIGRIAVVGAGKAGAGMSAGMEVALARVAATKQLTGWVNVPEDCVRSLPHITLHAARPAGMNEPTEAGVAGARRILETVSSLGPNDLCFCMISGGGSALLPAPVEAITLADKQAVTKHLSGAGANIEQLNTVRKQLSRIKGGGLARACRAGRLVTLIISDVIGDPLDVIASGPTVPDSKTPQDALDVLERFHAREAGISASVFDYLEAQRGRESFSAGDLSLVNVDRPKKTPDPFSCVVHNLVIGNNAAAVDAAGIEAERRGYSHAMTAATTLEGAAEDVGRHLANMARRMRDEPGPDCLITGGEPIVQLVDAATRGKGGRNQQLVLAALIHLLASNTDASAALRNIALLSGGTDGEDGPTDAAGAFIDEKIVALIQKQQSDPTSYLQRNDAYHFFEQLGSLIKTGPTHTNVCDLRVVTVSQSNAK